MPDVATPAAFNERFTIYLNTEGNPVERVLREMTATEVVAAYRWHKAEADRLVRKAETAQAIADAILARNPSELTDGEGEAIQAAITIGRCAAAACEKHARLGAMVLASIPQPHRHNDTKIGEALQRYWPGGRTA